MVGHRCVRLTLLLLIVSVLCACTANSPRRFAADCSQSPVGRPASTLPIETVNASSVEDSYVLGFVELDDQGHLYCRNQMNDVIAHLRAEASQRDVLMVVFVHGWRHGNDSEDDNLKDFRKLLDGLVADEHALASNERPPRRVAGVYISWRGKSLMGPGLEYLTFWDRKNTAATIGHGDVTEVFARLEQVKREKDELSGQDSTTRLVIIGHSFGGLIVHTALAQIMVSRFIRTGGPPVQYGKPPQRAGATATPAVKDDAIQVQGFGSLVVLINPAFEAQLFSSLSDMSAEQGHYSRDQPPLLAVLTSEADSATSFFFPLGRRVSTVFEKTRSMKRWNATTQQVESINESEAIVTSVGHFLPYRTHTLYPPPDGDQQKPEPPRRDLRTQSTMDAMRIDVTAKAANDWKEDRPGSTIVFRDVILERTTNSAGRNPYMVINVDEKVIASHNDLGKDAMRNFIKDLVILSTVPPREQEQLFRRFNLM